MSYLEERFKEHATQFISPQKADELIVTFKERAIGRFLGSTPSNDFSADEFDQYMQADSLGWSVDGFSLVEAFEMWGVGAIQNAMQSHFDAQLKAGLSLLEKF